MTEPRTPTEPGDAKHLNLSFSSKQRSDYFELVFQCAPIGMGLVGLDGSFLSANRALCTMVGYTESELVGRTVRDIALPDEVALTEERLHQLEHAELRTMTFEQRFLHKAGHAVWGAISVHVYRNEQREPVFFIAHFQDVTEQKQAERILSENEEKFRIAFENAPMGMSIIGPQGQYFAVNPALCRMFGYSKEDLLAGTINRITHPQDIERGNAWIRKMISGDRSEPEFEKRYIHKDGHIVWGLVRAEWVRNSDGSAKMSVVHILDITERKRAEQELLARERELREAHAIANMGHWQHELGDDSMVWADGIYHILEYPTSMRAAHESFVMRVHPEDRPLLDDAHRTAIERQIPTDIVHRLLLPDGRVKTVRRISRTELDPSGRTQRIVGILQDVSMIRRAEEERAKLENQLHQAQKMEAIGYLAGGIAHDFNNLLTVIGGNASLALLDTESSRTTTEAIEEILKGTASAAELTRQLLTFSRKQVIAPRIINLNDMVRHMSSMLKRLLGEDLQFETFLDPDLGQVHMDLGQAEQILINLAVNSRDAMANGGKLTVETANVVLDEEYCQSHADAAPGDFILLAVSDNGCGMSAETMRHIFEPFYTTKEQGRGTGLGLAMVYGAVHQNKGDIQVYSELGQGTTFRIYLPRVDDYAEEIRSPAELGSMRGHETIVLVEDDERVRTLGYRILCRQGYSVYAYSNASEALAALRAMPKPADLVITDVVMPGMNGKVFSEKVRELIPAVRVLFTSGYTQNVIVHHGVLDPGLEFLAKPYSYHGLAARVRALLDQLD